MRETVFLLTGRVRLNLQSLFSPSSLLGSAQWEQGSQAVRHYVLARQGMDSVRLLQLLKFCSHQQ